MRRLSRKLSITPKEYAAYPSVEDVFEKLGGFSWFQRWAMVVILSPEICAAMLALSPVLITSSNNVFFKCNSTTGEIFEISATSLNDGEICNGKLEPLGEHTSIIHEWNLIGSKAWVADSITSAQMGGSMLGALLAAQFAERFGRKKAHFSLCFLMGFSGFGSGFAPNEYVFGVARFITGFGVGGCFVVYMNYLMEFLTPSYRTICGCVSLWAVGEMLLALIGYLLPNWRYITYATSLPVFLVFLAYPWIPESPRWLLCQERTVEAIKCFEQIASWNRCQAAEENDIKVLQKVISQDKDDNPQSLWNALKIFKFKGYRKQLLVLMFAWFTNQLVYYGLSFNMKHLDGNLYWNVFYMGALDLPGSFTGILFNNRFGRKKTFVGFMMTAATVLIALIVTSLYTSYPSYVNMLSLVSRYFISAGFGVLGCFTAESFPTVVRVSCMGMCALCGNIGGMISPQFAYIGTLAKSSHFISFGVLTLLTCVASLTLRDRVGKPLKDAIGSDEGVENGSTETVNTGVTVC